MIDRKPVQLAFVFGATTGLYAASLAVVTGLQADHDRAVAALRAPVAADVGALGDANDRLAAELDRAVATYAAAADAYTGATEALVAHEARLAELRRPGHQGDRIGFGAAAWRADAARRTGGDPLGAQGPRDHRSLLSSSR